MDAGAGPEPFFLVFQISDGTPARRQPPEKGFWPEAGKQHPPMRGREGYDAADLHIGRRGPRFAGTTRLRFPPVPGEPIPGQQPPKAMPHKHDFR